MNQELAQRSRGSRVLSAVIVAALCGACGDREPSRVPDCTGDVVLTVTGTAAPLFSWSPECPLMALMVGEDDCDLCQYFWFIATEHNNGLSPGIRYGVLPEGTTELRAPARLLPGRPYRAFVFRNTMAGTNDWKQVGSAPFTVQDTVPTPLRD